jgi:gas vesicle protein
MKIEDILTGLPSKEEIASAMGLKARASTTGDMLTAFSIFGSGVILGAGLGLLLAPTAGQEIRHDITEKVGESGEHLHAQAPRPATSTNGSSV